METNLYKALQSQLQEVSLLEAQSILARYLEAYPEVKRLWFKTVSPNDTTPDLTSISPSTPTLRSSESNDNKP